MKRLFSSRLLTGGDLEVISRLSEGLIILSIILSVCLGGCHLPAVEGDFGRPTAEDLIFYLYKVVCGPVAREYKERPVELSQSESTKTFTLSVFGDIMFKHSLERFEDIYKEVPEELLESDFVFGNIEFPIDQSVPTSGFPRFNASVSYFEKIVLPLRLSVASIANNHCLDKGADGFIATKVLLEERGILALGGTFPDRFSLVEIDGVTVAFSAYTFGTNGRSDLYNLVNVARLNSIGLDDNSIDSLMETVREMSRAADVVILSLHWGLEHEITPSPNQVRLAHNLCDEGVDLIVGHHPHVLQPIESYRNSRDKSSLIIYSLGNWTTAMRNSSCRISSPLKLEVSSYGEVVSIEAFPFILDLERNRFLPKRDNEDIPLSIATFSYWKGEHR